MTVGDGDISINNIKDQFNTKMDGFTVTLTLKAPVKAGAVKAGDDQGGVASAGLKLAVWPRGIRSAIIGQAEWLSPSPAHSAS